MEHPATYKLSRDEWSTINRALCGARLQMNNIPSYSVDRKAQINDSLDIISKIYQQAKEETIWS